MTRSFKKFPVCYTLVFHADSNKQDKVIAQRKLRRTNAMRIRQGMYDNLLHLREVSNVWEWTSDGKTWFDPAEFPAGYRK